MCFAYVIQFTQIGSKKTYARYINKYHFILLIAYVHVLAILNILALSRKVGHLSSSMSFSYNSNLILLVLRELAQKEQAQLHYMHVKKSVKSFYYQTY